MANANIPMGLIARRNAHGAPCNFALRRYYIPAGDTNAMRPGDPVVKTSGLADPNGVNGITLATAGGRITGVIDGFVPSDGIRAGRGARLPGNAEYALVNDDPDALYEVQENGLSGGVAGSAFPVASVGKNANLVAAAGNGQYSGWQLDASTVATTATLQVRIVDFEQRVDNAPGTPFAKLIVQLNQDTETPGSAGI